MKEWKYVGWKNIMWFIEKFNPCSRVLSFENGHNLVLTAADVEDLFLLPRPREEGCDVLSYDRNDTVGFQFVEEFKNRLGLGAVPTHKSVFRLITNANDVRFNNGGEDFVILFILYALSTCLAPTSNTTLELNLLRTLKDVRDIHKFDWCLFVLKKLCKALESYKRGHYNVLNGCLLILPLLYCHHFKWQGKRLPFTLPLIRHWTSEKFNTRFKEESLGETVFGRGEWVVGVFPISEQNDEEAAAHVGENEQDRECRNRNDQDRQARNRNDQQTESDRRNEAEVRPRDEDVSGSRQLITYILPEGEKSDMCIDAISKNGLQCDSS
ncbi:uncharacterized protein LOC131006770 isoform X2 [Salvia miltiorrhiza]|uniref:uncharacterized protein LOC131006770 isoform X2 n=1 Tax=Salvia miltiorrhiza TaxID=226208 RepID=UPI0025AD3BD4|nr:uncharacterized protein LOC131006770 isoform X2 [Salvia miltiorrhiza]